MSQSPHPSDISVLRAFRPIVESGHDLSTMCTADAMRSLLGAWEEHISGNRLSDIAHDMTDMIEQMRFLSASLAVLMWAHQLEVPFGLLKEIHIDDVKSAIQHMRDNGGVSHVGVSVSVP